MSDEVIEARVEAIRTGPRRKEFSQWNDIQLSNAISVGFPEDVFTQYKLFLLLSSEIDFLIKTQHRGP